jgi:VCBS repeat-containing protein
MNKITSMAIIILMVMVITGTNVFSKTIADSNLPKNSINADDDFYNTTTGHILRAKSVLNNDSPNAKVTAQLLTSTKHGRLNFKANGTFSYTPDANYIGSDSFKYKVICSDSNNIATAIIRVGTPRSFSIVILPDTQHYSQKYPYIFDSQTTWIAENKKALKLAFVLHEGDITNNNNTYQWVNATASIGILDAAKVPYVIAIGNHDMKNAPPRKTTNFNAYFPVSRYSSLPTFGGVYEPNHLENSWHTFKAGGINWLVIALEFGPRDAVLNWANGVVESHQHHRVIMVTHAYMYDDETRLGEGDEWNPNDYKYCGTVDTTCNDGEELWNNFVKLHKNMLFVFSGHVLHDGTGKRVDAGVNGNLIYQMLANYQTGENGGNGFLRIATCYPELGKVTIESYSPYINQFKTEDDQQFEFTGVDLATP